MKVKIATSGQAKMQFQMKRAEKTW